MWGSLIVNSFEKYYVMLLLLLFIEENATKWQVYPGQFQTRNWAGFHMNRKQ